MGNRQRRYPSTIGWGLTTLVLVLVLAQAGYAFGDAHGSKLGARSHTRSRKWKTRQLDVGLGAPVLGDAEIQVGDLLGSSSKSNDLPSQSVPSSSAVESSDIPATLVGPPASSTVSETFTLASSTTSLSAIQASPVHSAEPASEDPTIATTSTSRLDGESAGGESSTLSASPSMKATSTASSAKAAIAPSSGAEAIPTYRIETAPTAGSTRFESSSTRSAAGEATPDTATEGSSSIAAASPSAASQPPSQVDAPSSAIQSAIPETSSIVEAAASSMESGNVDATPAPEPTATTSSDPWSDASIEVGISTVDAAGDQTLSAPSTIPTSAPNASSAASEFIPNDAPSPTAEASDPLGPIFSISKTGNEEPSTEESLIPSSTKSGFPSASQSSAENAPSGNIGDPWSAVSSAANEPSMPSESSSAVTSEWPQQSSAGSPSVWPERPSSVAWASSQPSAASASVSDVILQSEAPSTASAVQPSHADNSSLATPTTVPLSQSSAGANASSEALNGGSIPISASGSTSPSGDADNGSLIGSVSAPNTSGDQVMTLSATSSAAYSTAQSSSSTSSDKASPSVSVDDAYTPSQTWLIVATTSSSAQSMTSTAAPSSTITGTSTTASLPSTASIPSSIPTLIVPANSVVNQDNVGTGESDDPVKDHTLISILLSANQYPWTFVVKSSDATSQLFNTFPVLVSSALNTSVTDIKTYGLMVYQPASWNGDEASLLTQWLAYIPTQYFDTLNAYIKTQTSPLFTQSGIQGQLAAQINTAYPLAASTADSGARATKSSSGDKSTKTRDVIIGVCVGIGGLLWIALVFWIYKRVKRSNDKAVHKRLSEHMSMFNGNQAGYGAAENRLSRAPSLTPSEVDDRPSSFYASPSDNERSMRRQQRDGLSMGDDPREGNESPTTYGPSVFGTSWYAQSQPNHANPQPPMSQRPRASQNPFEDIVTRSYLTTSGSRDGGLSGLPQRRSPPAIPVSKGMISQPTLQANSLEFGGYK